jgi:hypothetical protein
MSIDSRRGRAKFPSDQMGTLRLRALLRIDLHDELANRLQNYRHEGFRDVVRHARHDEEVGAVDAFAVSSPPLSGMSGSSAPWMTNAETFCFQAIIAGP